MVKIDINLDAKGVKGRIAAIGTELKALEEISEDGFDFDEIELDGLGDEVDEIAKSIDDIDDTVSNLEQKLNSLGDDSDLFDDEIEVVHKNKFTPDGDTGSGDSTGGDPPSGGGGGTSPDKGDRSFSKRELSSKIEDLFGYEDRGYWEEVDSGKLNKIANDLEKTTQGLTSDEYDWFEPKDSRPDLENKDYNELQHIAGKEGVYPDGDRQHEEGVRSALREYYDSTPVMDLWDQKDPDDMTTQEIQKQASAMNAYPPNSEWGDGEDDFGWEDLKQRIRNHQFEDSKFVTRDGYGLEHQSRAKRRREAVGLKVIDDGAGVDDRVSGIDKPQIGDRDLSQSIQQYINDRKELAKKLTEDAGQHEFQYLNEEAFEEELSGAEKQATFEQAEDRGRWDFDRMDDFKAPKPLAKMDREERIDQSDIIPESLEGLKESQADLYADSEIDYESFETRDLDETLDKLEEDYTVPRGDISEDQKETWATINRDRISSDSQVTKPEIERDANQMEGKGSWMGQHRKWGLEKERQLNFRTPSVLGDIDDDEDTLKSAKRRFRGFGSGVKRLIPDMNQLHSIIAAIIPVAVVLGAQLLGVASAMGAVAVAGASIMGLGLVGHGENMEESFANAKEQLSDLKKELFQAAQPTMQLFAPIQDRMFEAIPGRVDDIAESMEGLIQYEDALFQLGGMLSEGLENAFEAISDNEDSISQLAIRFADLAGSAIFDFFGFLYKEARDNQEMLINLGGTLKDLMTIVFRVLRVLLMLATAFSPITKALLVVSKLLNNRIIQAIVVFAGTAYILTSALTQLGLAVLSVAGAMQTAWGTGFITSIISKMGMIHTQIMALISEYTALSLAATEAAAAMAMTGIGLLAVGGGALAAHSIMTSTGSGSGGSSGYSGGGSKRIYNDNRSFEINTQGGEMDYATQKSVENTIDKTAATKKAQELPDVDVEN